MLNIAKKILKWIPAVFIACVSFYLSSQPHLEMMPGFWNADKLVHFICYAGFCFWVSFACNTKNYGTLKGIIIPVLIVSLWGVSDEIHQSFVPNRSVSAWDWAFDTAGAVFGAVLFDFIRQKFLPETK